MANQREFSLLVKIMGAMDPSLTNAANLTKRQLKTFKNDIDSIDKALWGGLTTVAKVGLAAATAAGTATIAVGKKAVDVGSQFEKAMSQWAAVSDASVTEYNKAEAAALKWGRQTSKTATEAAEALTYMATAGWDVERSVDALPKVLKLAEATNLDLAHTSDLVANAMAATGSEAEDLGRMLDIAAKANNRSNQTAEQLLQAWRKTGANLDNLHVNLAESATAIGMLANRGKKAEEAGTALNAVLINMTTGAGQAGKMMEKLGLSAFDEAGNFKGLKQMFVELNEATKDLTDEERNQAFAMLGGKRQVEALTDIMSGLNHVLADGSTEWDHLYEDLMNANGALDKMAARRMDNLWGDVKILESALQDAGIRAYKGFADPLRDAAQMATKAVYDFSENVSDKIEGWYPTIRRILKSAGEDLSGFANGFIKFGGWIISHGDVVGGTLLGIATAITTFHTAWQGVKALDSLATLAAHWGMGLGALLGPLGAVSLAVGGTTAALVGFDLHMKKVNRERTAASFAKHFGTVSLSMKELRTVARQVVGEKDIEKMIAALGSLSDLEGIGKEIEETGDAIQRLTIKAGAGIELNAFEKEALGESIDTLIQQTQQALDQQKLTFRLNVDALFGDSEEGKSQTALFDQLNDQLRGKAEALGKELGDAYKKAMEDGIIEPIEADTIAELQRQLAELNQLVTSSESRARIKVARDELINSGMSGESFVNYLGVLQEEKDAQLTGQRKVLESTLAGYDLMLQQGTIDQDKYNALDAAAWAQYVQNTRGVRGRTGTEVTGAISERYGDLNYFEAGSNTVLNKMRDYAQTEIKNRSGTDSAYEILNDILSQAKSETYKAAEGYFGKDDFAGLKTLYDESKGYLDDLIALRDEYMALGQEVPEDVMQGASLAEMLKLAVGDEDYFDTAAELISRTPELMELIKKAQEEGAEIPKALTDAIEKKQAEKEAQQKAAGEKAAKTAAEGAKQGGEKEAPQVGEAVMSAISKAITERAALGLQIPVPLDVQAQIRNVNFSGGGVTGGGSSRNPRNPTKHALGAIVTRPEYSLLAEAGYPEAVIPINNSRRASALFAETGRMLSAAGANVGGSGGPAYAPTISIVVNGRADEGTIRGALRSSYEEWLGYAQRYQRDQARLAY